MIESKMDTEINMQDARLVQIRVCNKHYGITGCGVSRSGINKIDFSLKVKRLYSLENIHKWLSCKNFIEKCLFLAQNLIREFSNCGILTNGKSLPSDLCEYIFNEHEQDFFYSF